MNIIYLGCDGFPYGFAQVQKQTMISKALAAKGAKITVINRKGILSKDSKLKLKYTGKSQGIHYFYTSLSPFRSKSFILRNLKKLWGILIEIPVIFILRDRTRKNIAIITTGKIALLKYYSFILRLARYKIVLSYEEFYQSLDGYNKGTNNFDDQVHKYIDAILPISTFLEEYQKKLNNRIKSFKIPALTDFDLIDSIKYSGISENIILFCGAAAYFENIRFIIDSFENVKNPEVTLLLIIHGDSIQNQKIHSYIENHSSKKDKITIRTNLSYNELILNYKKSSVLLIPLKSYERDIARFPHKIAEYTASKTPILTTAVGEINYYFTNHVNAFIVENYDSFAFGNKIDFILNEDKLAKQVALRAYELGRDSFHYLSLSERLYRFFTTI